MARKSPDQERPRRGRPIKKEGTLTISATIPADLKATLEELAYKEDRSISKVLTRLIRSGLKHYKEEK